MPRRERGTREMGRLYQSAVEATKGYDVEKLHQEVVKEMQEKAVVEDPKTGYVVVKEANKLMEPELLLAAAVVIRDKWVSQFPEEEKPIKVLGIPNRGKELAIYTGTVCQNTVPVTDRQRLGDSTFRSYYDETQDRTYLGPVRSFTKGEQYVHDVTGLSPDDKNILVVDDFCATGEAIRKYNQELGGLGFNPRFAVLVAKQFPEIGQDGHRQLREEGVDIFAVSVLTSISEEGVTAVPGVL